MNRLLIGAILAAGLSGCGAAREDHIAKEVEETVRKAEDLARQSRTLSSLAKIEESIAAYYRGEKRIPSSVESMIPKYLAEVPALEIARHRVTNRVEIYQPDILRDGQIDGSRLRDTGRWGYVYNDRQVVIFIDCTHPSRDGKPWYQERGVY